MRVRGGGALARMQGRERIGFLARTSARARSSAARFELSSELIAASRSPSSSLSLERSQLPVAGVAEEAVEAACRENEP